LLSETIRKVFIMKGEQRGREGRGGKRESSSFIGCGKTELEEMWKRLRYLMHSLPQCLAARPVVPLVLSPLSW